MSMATTAYRFQVMTQRLSMLTNSPTQPAGETLLRKTRQKDPLEFVH